MNRPSKRSFADPDTLFTLIRSDTPVDVDGFKLGEPTGEVECDECGQSAAAPEYINHLPDCSQADVRSEWYYDIHKQ
ncbi:hypothetical protein EGH21_22420 [Halomicroarcula sp. F13]|uniref:Uncharacterized protein n=1 Tax=Haloarcula rubra TaxID=2487747 RepID=A0AAW4PX80_9EURY|nr:hypothetical protein [Halomicroarcula rubra]MBX0325776.1 hypothetical protein [Halomicroarcula rubra]